MDETNYELAVKHAASAAELIDNAERSEWTPNEAAARIAEAHAEATLANVYATLAQVDATRRLTEVTEGV
jgi:hypothetical protein